MDGHNRTPEGLPGAKHAKHTQGVRRSFRPRAGRGMRFGQMPYSGTPRAVGLYTPRRQAIRWRGAKAETARAVLQTRAKTELPRCPHRTRASGKQPTRPPPAPNPKQGLRIAPQCIHNQCPPACSALHMTSFRACLRRRRNTAPHLAMPLLHLLLLWHRICYLAPQG